MTFGAAEYTTRRRRRNDVETDEAAKMRDVFTVLFRVSDGWGLGWEGAKWIKIILYI